MHIPSNLTLPSVTATADPTATPTLPTTTTTARQWLVGSANRLIISTSIGVEIIASLNIGLFVQNGSPIHCVDIQHWKCYEIANQSYEVGRSTLTDLGDAQLALTQARLGVCQAVFSYLNAKSDLEGTLGADFLPEKR